MSYDTRQQTGDLGISIANLAIQKLGWIFREQPKDDHGIDAHIEIVEEGTPTGKLICLQIKSGSSRFKRSKDDNFIYRGTAKHLKYWTNHSLPVLVLLVDPDTEKVYWQVVEVSKVQRTAKGWKLPVPRSHLLDASARSSIESIADGSPSKRRLQRLRLDLELMRSLQGDSYNQLFIEAGTSQNKSLPRTGIRLLFRNGDGEEELIQDYGLQFGWCLESLLGHLFPWADASIDSDYYSWREDSDTTKRNRSNLRPYEDNGETESWRLELIVNDLGRAFLKVSKYLESDSDWMRDISCGE